MLQKIFKFLNFSIYKKHKQTSSWFMINFKYKIRYALGWWYICPVQVLNFKHQSKNFFINNVTKRKSTNVTEQNTTMTMNWSHDLNNPKYLNNNSVSKHDDLSILSLLLMQLCHWQHVCSYVHPSPYSGTCMKADNALPVGQGWRRKLWPRFTWWLMLHNQSIGQ